MKIVEPYAKMLSSARELPFIYADGVALLRNIEYAARVSHGTEDTITENSWDRFLRSVVLQHGDWSVVEHEKVTCEFLVDRGVTHEIVRHRLASYTQESTRFINYKKKGGEARVIRPDSPMMGPGYTEAAAWAYAMEVAEKEYMRLIDAGVKPQIARSVLPTCLASKLIMTMNLRGWRHFFVMRTSAQAHPQMRQVTDPLLRDFQRTIPILYEDIIAGGQQSEMMKLAR